MQLGHIPTPQQPRGDSSGRCYAAIVIHFSTFFRFELLKPQEAKRVTTTAVYPGMNPVRGTYYVVLLVLLL